MNKVITRIKGGLGNQLFCYSAARRLALANNAELVIDDVTGFVRDRRYGRRYMLDPFSLPARKAMPSERLEPFERYRRGLMKWLSRGKPFAKRSYLEQEGMDFDERLLAVKVQGTLYLDGLWQSEDYFKDVEATIRQDLHIRPPTDVTNLAMVAQLHNCTSVAVHVRFFDEPQAPGSNNAPGDYYSGAVEKMDSLASGAHYFVFSDQPEAARARIPLPDKRITLVSHNQCNALAYADLWLMTQCQHFIIANSTFSWWGAWLAESAEKIVIAPGFEKRDGISFWGFTGIIPSEWKKI